MENQSLGVVVYQDESDIENDIYTVTFTDDGIYSGADAINTLRETHMRSSDRIWKPYTVIEYEGKTKQAMRGNTIV